MTARDANDILAILRVAYPTFYARQTANDAQMAVALWADIFSEDNAAEVAAAVKALIATRTSNFPPVIGEVKEALQRRREPEGMTELEAWAVVSRAAAKCDLQFPARTFDALPEDIRRAVGSANMLKEWAVADAHEFQTVIASNFQRSWRVIRQRQWDDAKLPAELKTALPEGSGLQRIGLTDGR